MWYGDGWMFGMHFLWWIFWVLLIVGLVALLFRRERPASTPPSKATALEVLERRYAAGEVSTEEFNERRANLDRAAR